MLRRDIKVPLIVRLRLLRWRSCLVLACAVSWHVPPRPACGRLQPGTSSEHPTPMPGKAGFGPWISPRLRGVRESLGLVANRRLGPL